VRVARSCRPGRRADLLLASQLLDLHQGEGVDHGPQHLPGYPGVEAALGGDGLDPCQHLILSPSVDNAHPVSLFECDDVADEPSALDEELRESPVEIVEPSAHVGQVVLVVAPGRHVPILTFPPPDPESDVLAVDGFLR
jgi:hypothetical protein